jgi:hypothetical protein
MTSVAIHGQGLAARCCALLLSRASIPISIADSSHPRVPALVVSLATQRLLADVFEQPALFDNLPRIERRVVTWGPNAEPVNLPHHAVVISEEALLARLPAISPSANTAAWNIFASAARHGVKQQFGTRIASVVSARLKTPDAACWVESLETGWLFLIPGWLIAVGGSPRDMLSRSRLVAGQIDGIGEEASQFLACPRISEPLCGPDWLSCGTSAMAFDPICGDGTGNAVREAILAAAVIRAASSGDSTDRLLTHYRTRLMAAFQRHLEMCREYYRAGNSGEWWESEALALERGVRWCGEQIGAPEFYYRLEGFDLLPASSR